MLPVDPLWICIFVPAILVSVLVLIRFRAGKLDNQVGSEASEKAESKAQSFKKEVTKGNLTKESEVNPPTSGRTKLPNCPHYLGYLYMRKGPDRSYIPNECRGCHILLRCLYSPNVIEKVYGE